MDPVGRTRFRLRSAHDRNRPPPYSVSCLFRSTAVPALGMLAKTAFLFSLIISAALMASATGSKGNAWFAWVGLIPLFTSICLFEPRQAALCGSLWGLSFFLFWLNAAPNRHVELFPALLLLGVVPAVYAYGCARLTRRIGFTPLLLALGWIGVEVALRPLGFRNGVLAGASGDGWLIDLISRALGYGLVAFVVAYANASLLCVLIRLRFDAGEPALLLGLDAPNGGVSHLLSTEQPSTGIRIGQPRAPPRSSTRVFLGHDAASEPVAASTSDSRDRSQRNIDRTFGRPVRVPEPVNDCQSELFGNISRAVVVGRCKPPAKRTHYGTEQVPEEN